MKPARLAFLALACLVAAALVALPQQVTAANEHLVSDAIVHAKPQTVLQSEARTYLAAKADPTVKVWVYFTDKGVFSMADFEAKASAT